VHVAASRIMGHLRSSMRPRQGTRRWPQRGTAVRFVFSPLQDERTAKQAEAYGSAAKTQSQDVPGLYRMIQRYPKVIQILFLANPGSLLYQLILDFLGGLGIVHFKHALRNSVKNTSESPKDLAFVFNGRPTLPRQLYENRDWSLSETFTRFLQSRVSGW
jgi:hypothetical protein